MSTRAIAAVAHTRAGPVQIQDVVLDDLQAGEVLVRLEACGICHTDEKFRQRLPLPAVFGHEGVGIVAATGNAVSAVAVGDRVIISYPFCNECVACRRREPYYCERIPALKFAGCRADGTQPVRLGSQGVTSAFFQQSSFASHAIALEQALIPVGNEAPAGVLAALPCGVQTGAGAVINTFQAAAGEGLLVIGAGTVGLSAVMAAKLVGMDPIVCVEPHASRRALALQLGATQVEESWRHGAAGVRYALDTSATVTGLETAIDGICKGGTAGIVSYPDDGESFPFTTKDLFMTVGRIQAIMQGSSVPREFLPQLIEYWRVGRFPVDRLVTTYSFADIDRAFADMRAGDTVKAVLLMD